MILVGDCLDVLRTMDANSVDAIVTDPPYGLTQGKKGGSGAASVNLESPYGRARIGTGNGAGGFMGMKWDADVPSVEVWAECLRVLKPGGHLLAFAGTRTQHRMAVRIEDAGFEIRDMIAWVYGSGFPKSHNGPWGGTALKPALEPITVARKPLTGTVAENVQAHGTGGLNIDGCRVGTEGARNNGRAAGTNGIYGHIGATEPTDYGKVRWPANLIHDGSEEVVAAFPQAPGQQRAVGPEHGAKPSVNAFGDFGPRDHFAPRQDSGSAARFFKECNEWSEPQAGADIAPPSLSLQSEAAVTVLSVAATWPSLAGIVSNDCPARSTNATPSECAAISAACTAAMTVIASGCSLESQHEKRTPCGSLAKAAVTRAPTGTTTITASLWKSGGCVGSATFTITPTRLDRGEAASRLNYCAKASRKDRNDGCEGMPERPLLWSSCTQSPGTFQAEGTKRASENNHPTVKPTDLMRYLCRLVTPPGGLVLDPFMGSGSTGRGAILEGFRFVGIERDPDYAAIARARIDAVMPKPEAPKNESPQLSMFDEAAA